MNRRAFLGGIGIVTAGITSYTVSDFRPDGGAPPDRELTEVSASVPDGEPVSITPSIVRATIDSERTALFELSITWTATEPETLWFGNNIPFSSPNYSDDPGGLVLLEEDDQRERQNEDTWLPKTDDSGEIPALMNGVTGEMSENDAVTGSWTVWADPREVTYVTPGTYEFMNSIGRSSGNNSQSIDLSLSVTIREQE